MIYLSLAIALPVFWLLPWWSSAIFGFVFGFFFARTFKKRVQVAAAGALASVALALIRDGQSHGLISKRMSGLFGFHQGFWIFIVMALLTFITVLLCAQTGNSVRTETLKRARRL